jgi:tRNA threonylcarbamoyladenosine biosynthesis protein TsaB
MVILALETVTRGGSLALLDAGDVHDMRGDAPRTHGTRLPSEMFAFLASHGRTLADLDHLCVVTGPGSFTGIRIGLAAIQGLAMTSNLRVIPVPSLEALASAWIADQDGAPTRLVTCLDGARGDVFVSVFDLSGELSSGPGVAGGLSTQSNEPAVLLPPTVAEPLRAADAVAPFTDGPVTWIGDGVSAYLDIWRARFPHATLDTAAFNMARGAVLIGARTPERAVLPHALRPLYVRRPDAEIARARLPAAATSPVTVRRATPDDLRDVATLQRRSFTNAWGAEAIQWELDHTDVARLYVARTEGGQLIAYCACWIVFDELHINSLAVDDRFRRQKVARRLLDHVFRDAVSDGARMATLEVRQSNDAARALYEGLGFRIEGVRRNYYQDPREDGLILWNRALALAHAGGAS